MVRLEMNFCTNFVPPTRQSGLFSPSGRTQNQQLACYQYPLGVRFRPWPPLHSYSQNPRLRSRVSGWGELICSSQTRGRSPRRKPAAQLVLCVSNWIIKNPMEALKKPMVHGGKPTDYFTREAFSKLWEATYKYEYGGGNDCRFRKDRLRALVLR